MPLQLGRTCCQGVNKLSEPGMAMAGLSLRAPKPLTSVRLLRPGLLTYLNLWHSLTLSPLITEETAPTEGA